MYTLVAALLGSAQLSCSDSSWPPLSLPLKAAAASRSSARSLFRMPTRTMRCDKGVQVLCDDKE
jgi:hypothetical protein